MTETSVPGDQSKRQEQPAAPLRRRSPSAVAVVMVWAIVLLIVAAAVTYRYTTAYRRFANKALGPNVRHIDVQPSPGAAPLRVARPEDIARLRAVLVSAERSAPAGSHVHGADCTVQIVFGDGRDEQLLIGRTDRASEDGVAASPVVEIQWGGYTRYARGETLRDLLIPLLAASGASNVPVTQNSH